MGIGSGEEEEEVVKSVVGKVCFICNQHNIT
jgi:hypothetical protein